MKKIRTLLILALSLLSLPAYSNNIAVLVHGYLGDTQSWYKSGIIQTLERNGWKPGGGQYSGNLYYLISLPSEAPISYQAQLLTNGLSTIRKQQRNAKLIIIGHSAGGIVARYTMVLKPALSINGLITLASPHLGTDKAETALSIGNSPLSFLAPLAGANTINRSKALYQELVRERPGSFLYWLNRQKHPEAHYISIIRQRNIELDSDAIVPIHSQDMRNVSALKGIAKSYRVDANHQLSRNDGPAIAGILYEIIQQP